MKQVAQQEAERARYLVFFKFRTKNLNIKVEKAEQMKLAAITTAEGDAQASKVLEFFLKDFFFLVINKILFVRSPFS